VTAAARLPISVLDRKLFRDSLRLWAQVLAVALVVAGGVATFILSVGSYRSLLETRQAYYERYGFADVFASVRHAPKSLVARIEEIPGVSAVEVRIAKLAILDIEGAIEPATGQFISIPDRVPSRVNRIHLRSGRFPDPQNTDEVVVNESFAEAHRLSIGSQFSAILNGRSRKLTAVGTAMSPEFIYAIGPGDVVPDDRRFGVFWMSERALAALFDLEGAFTSVNMTLTRDPSERDVIKRTDELLDRYGGTAAYGRTDQISHMFLNHALEMLKSMSRTLPPVFLLVAAFLVNLTLNRMVALEHEQIGLMKAVGYDSVSIAGHYLKFVMLIAVAGIAIGSAAGTWLGGYVTGVYGDFFRFPFLVFQNDLDLYFIAAILNLGAALLGAGFSLRSVIALPPAVAMRPPAPSKYRQLLPLRISGTAIVPMPVVMAFRNVTQHGLRAAFVSIGMAFATGILVASLFIAGSMERLIDIKFFRTDRQDATIGLVESRSIDVAREIGRLPGVIAAEPYRKVAARIRKGSVERRILIEGRPRDSKIRQVLDTNLQPAILPQSAIAISAWLGHILGVRAGEYVEVEFLEGQRTKAVLPVAFLIEDYFGINAMVDANDLARMIREGPSANSVDVALDENQTIALYSAIKTIPAIASLALKSSALAGFRKALVVIVTTMSGIYVSFAAIIAFGVVYNNARVSLSERARELASLRVLGFSNAEVMRILLIELGLLTLLAQPPGWAFGYWLAWLMKSGMDGELMRSPLLIENLTYATASAIAVAAAIVSSLLVWARVLRLDLVEVLKTRD